MDPFISGPRKTTYLPSGSSHAEDFGARQIAVSQVPITEDLSAGAFNLSDERFSGFRDSDGQLYVPGSKLVVLGMVIQPLIGNPYNGYINPYYWVDDHPLLYGNNGSLDPGTYSFMKSSISGWQSVTKHSKFYRINEVSSQHTDLHSLKRTEKFSQPPLLRGYVSSRERITLAKWPARQK